MSRIFFFGTGADAEQVYLKLTSYKDLYKDVISGFVDNDSGKWGKMFHEYMVYAPERLGEGHFDYVVICSVNYQAAIREQLTKDLNIPEDRILFWRTYLSKVNIAYQYDRYIRDNPSRSYNNNIFDTSRTVVYTAIEGDYDRLKDPLFIGDNITYVCYTDNRDIRSDIWQMRYVDRRSDGNSALGIRDFKIRPHEYFRDYSLTIWVDASFTITGNLNEYARTYGRGGSFLCFPHPERKCIYQECGELISICKERPAALIRQAAEYLSDGYPENNGLYAGGVLVRDTHDKTLDMCMEDWWKEVNRHTLRDQQSLPYVLWKAGIVPDVSDLDINNNPYLNNNAHVMGHWSRMSW